jgi:hypothetical protein
MAVMKSVVPLRAQSMDCSHTNNATRREGRSRRKCGDRITPKTGRGSRGLGRAVNSASCTPSAPTSKCSVPIPILPYHQYQYQYQYQ